MDEIELQAEVFRIVRVMQDRPKKEIIKAVLEKRLIKETTITLALMNKDRFTKDEKGRYSLKTE